MVESTHTKIQFQLNRTEYGLSENVIEHTIQFSPQDYGIVQKYEHQRDLYKVELSPTIITLTTHKESNENIIKKSIKKEKLMDQLGIDFARKECVIHSCLEHDNVVKLHEYTENEDEFVIFMEYCNDANYFDEKLVNRLTPIYNQDKLQAYSLDILDGLKYIHSQGIIHSDMKLQNLLLDRPTPEEKAEGELPRVKVCDFGLSHIREGQLDGKSRMETRCGTVGYIAPEVGPKNSIIGPEIDMWAFGVMLYEMCTAYKPTVLQNFRYGQGPIPYRKQDWKKHDAHIQDLINSCLEIDPTKRLTPDDALQHPWFETE